jgi:amidase
MSDLLDRDATGLAELVRARQASPLELVDAAIARIEAHNGALNAVVTPLFERAREAARGPLPDGPFRGVPYLIKDVIAALAGVPQTEGSRLARAYVPRYDSELVRRLKRAGLIVVGKTNAPELGILPTTEPVLFGPTRNPWDRARTPGGSSGGAAAAVAARMLPAAHASDGGGSIRVPASCCGVFGLKPTRARNPLGPAHGDLMHGLVVEHAVTLSVRDSAALLDATSGYDVGDPYVAPPPARPFLAEVGADPGRLRVAVSTVAPGGAAAHEDCVAAVRSAAALLEELGHVVVEAAPEVDASSSRQTFFRLWTTCIGAGVEALGRASGVTPSEDNLEPLTWALYQLSAQPTARQHLEAVVAMHRLARQYQRFFVDHDLLLTPTLAEPPPPLGSFDAQPGDPLAGMKRAGRFTPFTPIANLTGQPAMSLPLHWNDAGLPIGVQVIGRFGDEATLLRLAAQLEAARPWMARRPPAPA